MLSKFKGGACRKPIGFVIKPRIILTKHKQTFLPSVYASVGEFFKRKGINPFMTEAVIIQKPVYSFAEEINGLVSVLYDNGLRHERG